MKQVKIHRPAWIPSARLYHLFARALRAFAQLPAHQLSSENYPGLGTTLPTLPRGLDWVILDTLPPRPGESDVPGIVSSWATISP